MELKTESNSPTEQKVRKKNHNFYKNQRNKVTKKLADDQKEKLISMAKSNLKNISCTSSNQNTAISKSNDTSTSCNNIFQNGEQYKHFNSVSINSAEKLHLSCSDFNLSKTVEPIDSSLMNVITPFSTEKSQQTNFNKNMNAKLNVGLENCIQENRMKHPSLIQFVGSEDNRFVRCYYCHTMIRFDICILNKHLNKCKQFVETTLNYIKQFNCFVCNITVNSLKDWKTHAVITNHLDKCMNMNDYISYDCGGCKTVFFGNKEQILSHCKEIHKNPSGLPSIFKFIKEVFHEFMIGSQKCWTFCSPCKKYSSSPIICSLLNHKNKKTKHFKCNTCLVDFKCSRDVYNKHLLSSEHFMLEHLRAKIKCIPESQGTSYLKLPPIFLNAFTFNDEKAVCNACKFQIIPDEKAITVHLTSCVFKSDLGGKNSLNIQKYFCAVCNEIISDFSQWKYHLILLNHLTKCHNFNDLVSYTCEICSLHCYGSAHHVTIHQDIHPNNPEKNFSTFIALNYQRINNNLKSKDFYYCEACDKYGEVNSSDHWNKSHKNKLKRMVCQPCRVEFFCIDGNNLFDRHTLSNEHILLKYLASKNTSVESKPCVSQKLNELKDDNEKSDPKDSFEILKNQLPSITKPYLNWFFEDKNKAICRSCDEILDVNENVLLSHMLVCEQISSKSLLETNINYFKCLECVFSSSDYKLWKSHLISHVKLDFYGLYSYFCKSCCSLLYGKMSDIEIHLNNEHSTVFSEMPLETSLVAKQLFRRNNNSSESPGIMCVCSPCNKIFKLLENPNHFNTDSHLSVASDIVELFYCKYCQVEFYSSIASIEIHKFTVEHVILSSKYIEHDVKDIPKPLKLDYHLLKFITNQTLYETTQNIGFFCFICDYLCLDLGLWKIHINGKKHTNSSKHFSCIDHRCKICKTLIFGKRQHIFEHYNNLFHSMLRQLKQLTFTNVEIKNNLFQTSSDTNHISKMLATSENNQKTECDKNIVGKSLNSTEIRSFQNVLLKLSTQSNAPHDCSKLGNSTSNIDEIHSVTKKVSELNLGLSSKQGNSLIDKSNKNVVETSQLKTTTDEIDLESKTRYYSNYYELKMKVLKEQLDKNNEIIPQNIYYCVPCDYITASKNSWDKHNSTNHFNEIEVRHQIFCNVCNLYEVGPSSNLDNHFKTIEHKNMEDFLKLYQPNSTKNGNDEAKEKNENESNVVSGKALNATKTSASDKQEISNNNKVENDPKSRKTMFEIKGIKFLYKKNSWAELKKIFSSYGYFGLYPRNNYVLIMFRKSASNLLFWKDKEKLEKDHEFTISVAVEEEEKLPELHKISKHEFGNKLVLTQMINTQLKAINQEISNPDTESRLIKLINSIHHYAGHHFIDGKIFPFGSRMSGLALKDSDVDLYFDIANTFFGSLSNDLGAQEDLVRYFGKVFRSQNHEFKQIQLITAARVPIVKFLHKPSGLNCDLSFKSGLSTHNTKLVRLYLNLDERVHWVVCAVVKRWALQNSIKNQSMFTSYALTWLVLFYLMTIKVVPPLKFLRDNAVYFKNASMNTKSDEMFIEDWDCTFCTPEKAKEIWKVPVIHHWQLLFNFFKFYSDSNRLKQYVLCPATGEALPKEYFVEIPLKCPEELGFDKKKIGNPAQWCATLKNNFSGEGLAMQDPFDLFHNITRTIQLRKLKAFSHLCNSTLRIMAQGNQPYYA